MNQRCGVRVRALCAMPAGALLLAFLGAGCMSVEPAMTPYTFVRRDPQLAQYHDKVYNPDLMNKRDKARVLLTHPRGSVVKFGAMTSVKIGGSDPQMLKLRAGVYPFQLLTESTKSFVASGAIMVYNIDRTIALATIGRTDETRLFNPDLVEKAKSGVLANYTVSFDGTDVITYWLGNRVSLYGGGDPTVELDFSQTPGITSLKIDGASVKNFITTLGVYSMEKVGGVEMPVMREYPVEMICRGKKYQGYIRNLQDNQFTAFVRIPCTVSQKLLDAAAQGTVAKLTVQSTGENAESVAEIVLSVL